MSRSEALGQDRRSTARLCKISMRSANSRAYPDVKVTECDLDPGPSRHGGPVPLHKNVPQCETDLHMSRGYNDYHPDGVLSFLRPGGLGFFHAFSLKAPPLGGAFFMVSNSFSKEQDPTSAQIP